MSDILVKSDGKLYFKDKEYRCALGRTGVSLDKREGDGATPIGSFSLRRLFYRADKFPQAPLTALPTQALASDDIWSDDSSQADYNTYLKLPYQGSHEKLWRDDDIYNLIVPLGYNDDPVVFGKGSAIFMHLARPDYSPTRGCVALAQADLLEVLSLVSLDTQLIISE